MGGLRSVPTYIYRHNSSYIFRITTPSDIRSYINKKEFRYSLRTGSLSVAKFRARVIVSMIQTLSTETLHAYPEEEYRKIISELP